MITLQATDKERLRKIEYQCANFADECGRAIESNESSKCVGCQVNFVPCRVQGTEMPGRRGGCPPRPPRSGELHLCSQRRSGDPPLMPLLAYIRRILAFFLAESYIRENA